MASIVHAPIFKKVNTIDLSLKAALYLRQVMHDERCKSGRSPLSENTVKRISNSFMGKKFKRYHDGDFGGCNGSPINAWEEGRWTNWSVHTMEEMLRAEGFAEGEDFKIGEPEEIILL